MRFIPIALLYLVSLNLSAQNKGEAAIQFYETALSHYRAKEFGLAYEACQQSLALLPRADTYYLEGLIHEAQGRELRAVAAYEAALQYEPDFREATFQKGILYLKNGDPEQAIRDFNILLKNESEGTTRGIYFEVNPENNHAVGLLTVEGAKSRLYYYRATALMKVGDKKAAKADLDAALKLSRNADYLNARALWYESQSKLDSAVKDLREAVALQPNHELAWYNLVRLDETTELPEDFDSDDMGGTLALQATRAHERGDLETALRLYNRAVAVAPDPLTLMNRGRVLNKLKRFAVARADFAAARTNDPTRVEALYLIGNTHFFQNEMEQALVFYNQYLAVDPLHAETWYNAAMCYLKLSDEVEACHYLRRASRLGMPEATHQVATRCGEE